MTEDRSLLDRSDSLTQTGIALLRVASGVFFLIPGIFKILMPGDFLAMTVDFPGWIQPHLPWLFNLVIFAEVIGGLMLIIGWNVRLAVPPLVLITVVAESLVVVNDHASSLRLLSVFMHFMGAGLYTAMFFLGSGRWCCGKRFSAIEWLARQPEGRFSNLARDIISGTGRNFGVFLIRVSVSIPFIAAFFLGYNQSDYQAMLPSMDVFRHILLILSLLGGLSMLTGFQVRSMGWLLAGLTLLHMLTLGLTDLESSRIGIINLLFHLLIIAAVISLRLISFGSELEAEHILSLDKRNVVVVGGGFAGTQLVRRLEKQLSNDWQVVLISEENYTTFNPMLAEVVGASVLPSHVIAPIRRMITRTRFVSGRVTQVDTNDKRVHYDGEDKCDSLPYEHLVFAFGSRANLDLVPGMKEHAMPFKLLGDALNLRNRVIQQMEKADQEEDPEQRRWMGHFIVIGAGFSGVEVGGAIQDFIRASQKHYPRLHDQDLQVSILHRRPLPLQELSPSLGEHALKKMPKRGIKMEMETGVNEVDARGVITGENTRIDGATVICTIGTRPNPLINAMDIENERGRIKVAPDMSVTGQENLWAVGDCAIIPNAHDDALAPPTAQFAIREGVQLADNIARSIKGKPTRPFNYESKGSMATIGHLNGVAEMFGFIRLGGFPAWLAWRGFYLMLMPTLAKRTRILFEWAWSMLFSPDIINLRFTTTKDADVSRVAKE